MTYSIAIQRCRSRENTGHATLSVQKIEKILNKISKFYFNNKMMMHVVTTLQYDASGLIQKNLTFNF